MTAAATAKKRPGYVPTVEECPYMIEKPNSEKPRYFKRFKDAQASILNDINRLKDIWQGLNIQDSVKACRDLLDQANQLSEWEGGSVAGLCDPYTGMWYRASLVRRQQV